MQYLQPIEALILAGPIAWLAWRAHTLSSSGAWAGFAIGFLVFGLGGLSGAVPLLVFFVSSNILGRWRHARKAALGFEKGGERDWAQVLANSAAAAVMLTASTLFARFHIGVEASRSLYICFAAAMAEANADTWATEFGSAINGRPRLIATFEKTEHGRSGAVSAGGMLAALAGSALIGACAMPYAHSTRSLITITLSGLIGSIADSLFGALIQASYIYPGGGRSERKDDNARLERGIPFVNNDVVNLLSTITAIVAAVVILRLW